MHEICHCALHCIVFLLCFVLFATDPIVQFVGFAIASWADKSMFAFVGMQLFIAMHQPAASQAILMLGGPRRAIGRQV